MAWPELADCALTPAVEVMDHGDVTYTPPDGDTAYPIRGIFDAEHVGVSVEAGALVDSISPALGVRLQDFLDILGEYPEQGGRVDVGSLRFEVRSVQPDGSGGARLELEQLQRATP